MLNSRLRNLSGLQIASAESLQMFFICFFESSWPDPLLHTYRSTLQFTKNQDVLLKISSEITFLT